MYIYDGDNPLATEIGTLTGLSPYLPDNVISTGPDIYISFISDTTETANGFKIRYNAGKKGFLFLFFCSLTLTMQISNKCKLLFTNNPRKFK